MDKPYNHKKLLDLMVPLCASEGSKEDEINRGYLEILIHLAAGFQYKEVGIVEHLRRIAAYVEVLAGAMGWSEQKINLIKHASLFHDVGMVDIPESILMKEGALKDEEMEILKQHTLLGSELLKETGAPLLNQAAILSATHHEHFNGSGYPQALQGEAIPISARILSVCDVFDALTTRRPFKEPYPFDVALEIIHSGSGSHFDPEVVDFFLKSHEKFKDIFNILGTTQLPARKGFRISERDRSKGNLFSIAREGYFNCPFCQDLHPNSSDTCPVTKDSLQDIHKLSGLVLEEKYRLRGSLGVGGMGVVYEAMHMLIDRKLAIKFLKPNVARDSRSFTRFYNEARVFAKVGHPNLVEITDMGRTPEGLPYIVMEHLDGTDLDKIIEAAGRLKVITAVTITLEILNTLAAVHSQGILHRDLKPDNIYIVKERGRERLKILDFGISYLMSKLKTNERLTQDGFIFGSPCYMSPEQAMGAKKLDQRCDLFAVGSLLYEMLAGQRAFKGDNPLSIVSNVKKGKYKPLQEIVPDLPEDVISIVDLALTVDINLRFQSADEFAQALQSIALRDPRFEEGRILDLWSFAKTK